MDYIFCAFIPAMRCHYFFGSDRERERHREGDFVTCLFLFLNSILHFNIYPQVYKELGKRYRKLEQALGSQQ